MKYEIESIIQKIKHCMLHGRVVNHYSMEHSGFAIKFETNLHTAGNSTCNVDVYVAGGREPILFYSLNLNNPTASIDEMVRRLEISGYVF